MRTRIHGILADYGRLPVDVGTLADAADLYQAEMTSHAGVSVMLALKDPFDLKWDSDEMLTGDSFESGLSA